MIDKRCPRRMFQVSAGQGVGPDTWVNRHDTRTCSYCGSLHPDDVITRLTAGEKAGPTDKNYKLYVGSRDKACFQHFNKTHMDAFIALYNAASDNAEGKPSMNVGTPGYFYQMPFFMRGIKP
jgi:hypothetical protein